MENQRPSEYRLLVYQTKRADSPLVLRREFSNLDDVLKFINDFRGLNYRFLIAEHKTENISNNYLIISSFTDYSGLNPDPKYSVEGFENSSVSQKDYIREKLKLRLSSDQNDNHGSNQIVDEYLREETEKQILKYQKLALLDLDINLRQPIYTALQKLKWINQGREIKPMGNDHKTGRGNKKYVEIEKLLKMLSEDAIFRSVTDFQNPELNYSKTYKLVEREILKQVAIVIQTSKNFALVTSDVAAEFEKLLYENGMSVINKHMQDEAKKSTPITSSKKNTNPPPNP